jgi:hypothetical protein
MEARRCATPVGEKPRRNNRETERSRLNVTTARAKRRWKVGIRSAPASVASVAARSSQRKSAAPPLTWPASRFPSTRFARSGAWKELEVRETSTRTLNSDSETAIRPVRVPAMRTE